MEPAIAMYFRDGKCLLIGTESDPTVRLAQLAWTGVVEPTASELDAMLACVGFERCSSYWRPIPRPQRGRYACVEQVDAVPAWAVPTSPATEEAVER